VTISAMSEQAFKAWFKNSKVVDKEGKPLPVYHGTDKGGFHTFDPTKTRKGATQAIFFTDNASMAGTYTKSRPRDPVPEIYDNIKQLIGNEEEGAPRVEVRVIYWDDDRQEDYTSLKEWEAAAANITDDDIVSYRLFDGEDNFYGDYELDEVDEILKEASSHDKATAPGVYECFLSIQDPIEVDAKGANWDSINVETIGPEGEKFVFRGRTDDLVAEAEFAGHDGAIIRNVYDCGSGGGCHSGDVFVVFKPSQIKYIHNVGTWSDDDDDIRASVTAAKRQPKVEATVKDQADVEKSIYALPFEDCCVKRCGRTAKKCVRGEDIQVYPPRVDISHKDVPDDVADFSVEYASGKYRGTTPSLENVRVEDLIISQDILSRENLLELAGQTSDPVLVAKYDDKLYLVDGNHRVALAILQKEPSVRAKVYTLPSTTIEAAVLLPVRWEREGQLAGEYQNSHYGFAVDSMLSSLLALIKMTDVIPTSEEALAYAKGYAEKGRLNGNEYKQDLKKVERFLSTVKASVNISDGVSTEEAEDLGAQLGLDFSDFSLDEFQQGIKVEREHEDVTGLDPLTTAKIALAHLREMPDYYTKLRTIEARRTAATREVMFHGTSSGPNGERLRSILKQGMIPTAPKTWDEDKDAEESGDYSRVSYGGTYFTKQPVVALSSARYAAKNDKTQYPVFITALIQAREAMPDEDDFTGKVEGAYLLALGRNTDNTDLADTFEFLLREKDGSVTEPQAAYLAKRRALFNREIVTRTNQMLPKSSTHTPMQADLTQITDALFDAETERRISALPKMEYKTLMPSYKDNQPTRQEGEAALRVALDQYMKQARRYAINLEQQSNGAQRTSHTLRVMEPVTYSGRSRIIGVCAIPNYAKRDEEPIQLVSYYGDNSEIKAFFEQRGNDVTVVNKTKGKA
jgi:hypothetical protein